MSAEQAGLKPQLVSVEKGKDSGAGLVLVIGGQAASPCASATSASTHCATTVARAAPSTPKWHANMRMGSRKMLITLLMTARG